MGKIAWGITGAGHFLRESLEIYRAIAPGRADLFVSQAGIEVLKMYSLAVPDGAVCDKSASTTACRAFSSGAYDVFVVAPATSNSVAKFALGISDCMMSTLFAQCGKSRTPIIVLPSDAEESMDSMGATKPVKIYPRFVDLENVEKLKRFDGVSVAFSTAELKEMLAPHLAKRK
ncbi:MAG: flavoprotein [Nitrospinae bacterium]|nr:flavoprotein [Nitrospinota bacterium]